jgi:hypothetical protein
MKPEREDKLCEEMAMRLSALSLHKTTNNVIFIPLPRPVGPTSPFHYCLSFSFFIFNYTDPPGVDPCNPEPDLLIGSLPGSGLKTMLSSIDNITKEKNKSQL